MILPFKLETPLERAIATDPEWLEGIAWGRPRPGHPEGQVAYHIRAVLDNIDRFFGSAGDRSSLRLIALIHDTFKHKAARSKSETPKKSHGYFARQFAARYIDDAGILQVIELHDEAYKASLLISHQGDRQAAERQARKLMVCLGSRLDLFMRFYLCDNQTGDKSAVHYEWFKGLVEKQNPEGGEAIV